MKVMRTTPRTSYMYLRIATRRKVRVNSCRTRINRIVSLQEVNEFQAVQRQCDTNSSRPGAPGRK